MAESEIKLDELGDHDLLVRIATKIECLPDLQRRVGAVELDVARLKERAVIIGASVTAAAAVATAVINVLF